MSPAEFAVLSVDAPSSSNESEKTSATSMVPSSAPSSRIDMRSSPGSRRFASIRSWT